MSIRRLSPLMLAALAACSGAPAQEQPSQTPKAITSASPAAASASSSAEAPQTAAPSDSASPAAASASAPTSAPAASASPSAGAPGPAPLTEAEQKETETKCKPLMKALDGMKGSGKSPLEALTDVLKKPPASLKQADLARCTELLDRGIRAYLIAAKTVEAKVMLKQIGLRMAAAYADTGKLCPSTQPVPADKMLVTKGPYTSTEADWSNPTWQCMNFNVTGQPQRFQYEVNTDQAQKTFVIIARGTPGDDGRWMELRLYGKVNASGEVETSSGPPK